VVTCPVGAPVIHRMARISIGPRGQPQGPLATDRHNTANLACPFPRCVRSAAGTSFKRGRPFGLWDRISRVCATIGYSVGSLTTPPHPTKAEHPSLGTQRPGLAGEWAEEEGERHRGTWMSGYGSAPEEVIKWRSNRRRTRFGDGGPSSPARSSGASGTEMRNYGRVV
jgi:hypothetical protein